jgi:RNA polymerase sigma-70 factor (ECF subfamily)
LATDRDAEVSDADLLCQTKAGDIAAYGVLVERYRKKAFFGALAWVGHREEALDITQEAFARGYQAIARFDTSLPFYPWLYRIVRNLCFSHLRKSGGRRTVSLSSTQDDADAPQMDVPDARFDPRTLASRSEVGETVWHAINALSARDREIIIMNHFLEMSYQETADALTIPIGTVMSRLYYARQRLRERLSRFVGSGETG